MTSILFISVTDIRKFPEILPNMFRPLRKDPGPEGPALVDPGGVMKEATFTNRVQVSGVGCQVSATEVDPLNRSRS